MSRSISASSLEDCPIYVKCQRSPRLHLSRRPGGSGRISNYTSGLLVQSAFQFQATSVDLPSAISLPNTAVQAEQNNAVPSWSGRTRLFHKKSCGGLVYRFSVLHFGERVHSLCRMPWTTKNGVVADQKICRRKDNQHFPTTSRHNRHNQSTTKRDDFHKLQKKKLCSHSEQYHQWLHRNLGWRRSSGAC